MPQPRQTPFFDKNQFLVELYMHRPGEGAHTLRSEARKVYYDNDGFYAIAFFYTVLNAHFGQYLISRINV
jgi:hypothetical protein